MKFRIPDCCKRYVGATHGATINEMMRFIQACSRHKEELNGGQSQTEFRCSIQACRKQIKEAVYTQVANE